MFKSDDDAAPVVIIFSSDLPRIGEFNSGTVRVFPLGALPEKALLDKSLAAVVVSVGDKGFGSIDELKALEGIQADGVPASAFILAEGLDDDEIAAVTSYSLKALHTRSLKVELISGSVGDLASLIASLTDDSELIDLYRHRRARVVEAARSHEIALAEVATKEEISDYLNVRIACQRIVDEAKALEAAIDRALADSIQRVSDGELLARLIRDLKTRLDKIHTDAEWITHTPDLVATILSTWQVERVNNFLHDIKRFADVDITFSASESPTGMNIMAEVRPADTKENLDRVIRVGGTAVLTKVAIVAFIPVLAPVVIPIALGTAVFSWVQWSKGGRVVKRDRFVSEINAELIAEVRNATITVCSTLRTTADLAKNSVRESVRERLRDLLAETPTMSDEEASKRVGDLKKLMAQ
jgi:hypothetical protein